MGWSDHAAELELWIDCDGGKHSVVWSRGRLRLDAHDPDAEAALAAFGGTPPACLTVLGLWRSAVTDGGFLEEWARHPRPMLGRRDWLEVALRRLRAEGVQDFLFGLPAPRAERMGRVLIELPPEFVDRAGVAVAARILRRRTPIGPPDPLLALVADAVRVRARTAFVHSLRRWAAHVRPAALVRFRCAVDVAGPAAVGVLAGRDSWCELRLDAAWLVEVWGRGATLDPDGDLVVAVDADHGDVLDVRVLRWSSAAGSAPTPAIHRARIPAPSSARTVSGR